MNFPDHLLPDSVQWAAHLCAALLLLGVLRRAPWRALRQPGILNLWLGASVTLMALWSIKTGIKPGLNFHLLGATALTLMFGPRLALLALAGIVAGITAAGHAGWQAYSLNWMLMGALPVAVSHAIFRFVDGRLTNHFFVYVFINAFFGAALAIAATGLAASLLLGLMAIYPFAYLSHYYLPYYVFMGWSEALTTGMLLTLMVVYRPHWVGTFDDARYLNK